MKVALLQTDIAWNDPATNVTSCRRLATAAVDQGAQLLIFPEMFTSGFSLPVGELATESGARGQELLSEVAEQHKVATIGSLPEIGPDGKVYNTAYVFQPNGVCQSYRKMHLFSFGEETSRYTPGEQPLTVSIDGLRCTLFICYDLRFPIPFYKRAQQTDLFIVVANWPTPRREHWQTLLRARSIENQAYVAGVNRVGDGGGLHYSGDSMIFAPDGSPITEAVDGEAIVIADVSPQKVSEWRETFPALRDRREDVYESL
jgi:predicted amidohydrolase